MLKNNVLKCSLGFNFTLQILMTGLFLIRLWGLDPRLPQVGKCSTTDDIPSPLLFLFFREGKLQRLAGFELTL